MANMQTSVDLDRKQVLDALSPKSMAHLWSIVSRIRAGTDMTVYKKRDGALGSRQSGLVAITKHLILESYELTNSESLTVRERKAHMGPRLVMKVGEAEPVETAEEQRARDTAPRPTRTSLLECCLIEKLLEVKGVPLAVHGNMDRRCRSRRVQQREL